MTEGSLLAKVLEEVRATGAITAEHVRRVRGVVYPDMHVDKNEAEHLFALDEAAATRDPAWIALFCEALVDLLVKQERPQGHVDEAKADWLTARIAADGAVKTETELEALVKVLEAAERVPQSLVVFALDQVRRAVVDGAGPLAGGGALERGRVTEAEAELVRRVLYAYGGQGAASITKAEAEILFDINDASEGAANHPAWTDVFVKALANFLMAASGYQAPSREVALARQEWWEAETDGVAGMFARMGDAVASKGLRGIIEAYRTPGYRQLAAERNAAFEAASAAAEPVTGEEAQWLAARMNRDGKLGEAERALLRFLREENPAVHPSLKPLMDAA